MFICIDIYIYIYTLKEGHSSVQSEGSHSFELWATNTFKPAPDYLNHKKKNISTFHLIFGEWRLLNPVDFCVLGVTFSLARNGCYGNTLRPPLKWAENWSAFGGETEETLEREQKRERKRNFSLRQRRWRRYILGSQENYGHCHGLERGKSSGTAVCEGIFLLFG